MNIKITNFIAILILGRGMLSRRPVLNVSWAVHIFCIEKKKCECKDFQKFYTIDNFFRFSCYFRSKQALNYWTNKWMLSYWTLMLFENYPRCVFLIEFCRFFFFSSVWFCTAHKGFCLFFINLSLFHLNCRCQVH